MRSLAIAMLLAGCGRIAFDGLAEHDAPPDAAPDALLGHDEDGDGIADVDDPCPHVAMGGTADLDGDGVGDACDPNPGAPTEHYLVFSPLTPGTNPFDQFDGYDQQADALHVITTDSGKNLIFKGPFTSARFEIGFEIHAIAGTGQHQVAGGLPPAQPYYFVELNENAAVHEVGVVSFDPSNGYQYIDQVNMPAMHPGVGVLRYDAHAGTAPRFDVLAGWTGELYQAGGATPAYTGSDTAQWTINGLDIDIRYVAIIALP